MMSTKENDMKLKQTILSCSIVAALTALPGAVSASGFALIEQSASGLGNAYAGGAASAEDASTIYFNPAGMSRLRGDELVLAGHAIKPSTKFSNTASVAAALQPTVGGEGGDAGSWAAIPNAYFSMKATQHLSFGLGLNVPFGLQTEYDADWMGRFQAIKSRIETTNLNPSVAYRIGDAVSIGAGLNYQDIKGDLTSVVNYSAAAGGALGAGLEGVSTISGTDSAWGYNLGMLVNPSAQTRIGLAYRSKIKFSLEGTASFANRPAALAAAIPDGPVTLALKTPDTLSASLFHQLNDQWDIMADATWTGWSVFKQLQVVRSNNGAALLTVPENWRNTWRVGLGASHHYNERWTTRMGVAYDQTPTSNAYRTARIPDSNRTWLALGGQYKPAKQIALDFGYAHLFMAKAPIADMQAAAGKGDLVGTYKNSVDILSMQYTHSFY